MQKRYAAAGAALLVLVTTGCETTNTGVGALVGSVTGAAMGDVVGRKMGPSGRLATTVAFSAGGALVGASIGSMLDARDRENARAATLAALRKPLPPQYYQPDYQPAVYSPPLAAPAPAATPRQRRSARAPVVESAPAIVTTPAPTVQPTVAAPVAPPAPAITPNPNFPNLPIAPDRWVSEHSGASGTATVIRATPPSGGRGECRTLKLAAAKNGQERSDTETFCETAPRNDTWEQI